MRLQHCACLQLIASSSFGVPSLTNELMVRGAIIYAEWMRARLVMVIRYLSNDSHSLSGCSRSSTTSPTTSRPSVIQGLGHQSYTRPATRRSATARQDLVARRADKDLRARHVQLTDLLAIPEPKDASAWQKAGVRWWMEQGPAITSQVAGVRQA